jgi:hypothetical protein
MPNMSNNAQSNVISSQRTNPFQIINNNNGSQRKVITPLTDNQSLNQNPFNTLGNQINTNQINSIAPQTNNNSQINSSQAKPSTNFFANFTSNFNSQRPQATSSITNQNVTNNGTNNQLSTAP